MKITYSHEGREEVRTLARDTVLVGRGNSGQAPDLDLSPDIHVSRKHARLTERQGVIWVEDLGSRQGTTLNGQPVRGECRLSPGDVIGMGNTMLRVEPSAPPPAAPLAPAEAQAPPEFDIEIALDQDRTAFVSAPRPGLETERRLAFLVDLAGQLGTPTSLDYLLQSVLRRVMELVPEAERGAVLLGTGLEREMPVKACVSPDGPAVSGTLARRAIEEGRGFIWRRNLAPSLSASVVRHKIAAGLYAPMRWQDQNLGVICLDSSRIAAVFNSDDLRLVMAVAQYAALAVSHHQLQEELGRTQGKPPAASDSIGGLRTSP